MVLKEGLPVPSKNQHYIFSEKFLIDNTAFIVMDPWIDAPSDFLNNYFGRIIKRKIIPLVNLLRKCGFKIYTLTNNCKEIKPSPYSCKIDNFFERNTEVLYHDSQTPESFMKLLQERNISNLVYMGFASNMCVIGRNLGMIAMRNRGFSLYFIPDASAAVEVGYKWEDQKLHKAATLMISQWIGGIMDYWELYKAIEKF
jgi:hypothetical protein